MSLAPTDIKIQINDKPVTLSFEPEPNTEAANFIKRTLVDAYLNDSKSKFPD